MKKLLFVLILIISTLLCSCMTRSQMLQYEDEELENKAEELLSVLKAEDKEALISLFSTCVRNEAEDLDEKADELFEYIEGDILSYDIISDGSSGGREDGKRSLFLLGSCEIVTTEAEYHLSLDYTHTNQSDPDEEGISYISIIKKDNGVYVYGPGSWMDPGINIDTKKVPDNANLSAGGRLGYTGDQIAFCIGNTLMTADLSGESPFVSTLREFNARIPREITCDNDIIYFKLTTEGTKDGKLYLFNTEGTARNILINENVDFYKIHNHELYYTQADADMDKGIYKRSASPGADEGRLIIEGDVSEFVFRHRNMYYVEDGSVIRYYDVTNTETGVVTDAADAEIFDMDIDGTTLYYCTRTADGEYRINKTDVTTKTSEILYTGISCGYLHTLRDNRLIFKTEAGYQLMTLDDGNITPILTDYELSELYVFEDAIFFNVLDSTTESWYRADIDSFEVTKIA